MPKIAVVDPISGQKYWKDEDGNKTWEHKDPITGRTYRQDGMQGKREYFNSGEDGGNKNVLNDDGAHTVIKDEFGMTHFRGHGGQKTAQFTSPTGYEILEKRGTHKKSSTQRYQAGYGAMFGGNKSNTPQKSKTPKKQSSYGFAKTNDTSQTGGMGQITSHIADKHSDKTTVYHSNDGKTIYINDKTSGGMFSGNSGGISNGSFSMFSNGHESMISVGDPGSSTHMDNNMGFSQAKNFGFSENKKEDFGAKDFFSPQNLTTGFNYDNHDGFFDPSNLNSGMPDIDADKPGFNYGSGMFGSYDNKGDGSPF